MSGRVRAQPGGGTAAGTAFAPQAVAPADAATYGRIEPACPSGAIGDGYLALETRGVGRTEVPGLLSLEAETGASPFAPVSDKRLPGPAPPVRPWCRAKGRTA